jgi:sugar/nucleoside kinase (ribokinase family)
LIGNEYELLTCTEAPSLDAAASRLLAAGVRFVVAKRGSAGSAGFTGSERVDAPGFDVDAISTVGAGDAFNAGVFAALSRGQELAAALRFGNAVAALVISSERGVLDGPSRHDVEALLRSA